MVRRYEVEEEVEDALFVEAVSVPADSVVVAVVADEPEVTVPAYCVDEAEEADEASVAFVRLNPSG